MVKPKFEVGQLVKLKNDTEYETGKVIGYSFDGEIFRYQIESREVDIEKKRLIEGFKTAREEELEVAKEKDAKK